MNNVEVVQESEALGGGLEDLDAEMPHLFLRLDEEAFRVFEDPIPVRPRVGSVSGIRKKRVKS